MAKRDKSLPKQHVTRRRLARWQQERRKRRFYVSVGVAIIAVVIGIIIYGVYTTNISMAGKWVTTAGGTRFVGTDYADALHLCQLGFYGNTSSAPKESPISVIELNELVKLNTALLGISVNDSELTAAIKSSIEGNQSLTDEQFQQAYQKALDNMKLTQNQFEQFKVNALLQQKLYEHLSQDVPDVGGNVSQVYLEQLAANESQLADIQSKVDSGDHLADLKDNFAYTEIGWIPQGVLPANLIDVENVVFNLSVGEVSNPILVGNASYFFFEVTDKEDRPLDDAMRSQLEYNLWQRWITEETENKVQRNPDLDLDKMYDWALTKIGG